MMGDRFRQQVVETSVVAALGGRVVDLEQRFRLGSAVRLMLDRACGQDLCAPGGIVGVQRAGEVHPTPGRRTLAGDYAVAHDGQRLSRGVAAGWFKDVDRVDAPWLKGSHSSRLDFDSV